MVVAEEWRLQRDGGNLVLRDTEVGTAMCMFYIGAREIE